MYLQIENVYKNYGNREVLKSISLHVEASSTISILGKSGCGKSTLLKIIAGIEQEALLFPHLNVFENVAFGLRIRKESTFVITQKVNTLLQQLGLHTEAKKMPHQMSGGQKQRVAFGRALIINPPLMLLDEPFSSLDVETRTSMQQLYKSIAAAYNITALFVTHDLKESLIMGDKIAYMENGLLTVYHDKKSFINDLKTGVTDEINFWNTL
jgi:ABC-type Fe3+/spermidine/putrescine transport system ATPase subunit